MALKISGKIASRAALGVSGVGTVAAVGLLAYDAGEATFSEGARKEYTLVNPAASEEDKQAAVEWLINNDPERVGIPEEIAPEDRNAYLQKQDENPDSELTAKEFNEGKFEDTGPSEKQIAELQQKVTDRTTGMFNRESNDINEANEEIAAAGMTGKVYARQTDQGIELETSQQRSSRMEGTATSPAGALENATDAAMTQPNNNTPSTIVPVSQGGQQAPSDDRPIVVTLPKTILSLDQSAMRFNARRV